MRCYQILQEMGIDHDKGLLSTTDENGECRGINGRSLLTAEVSCTDQTVGAAQKLHLKE